MKKKSKQKPIQRTNQQPRGQAGDVAIMPRDAKKKRVQLVRAMMAQMREVWEARETTPLADPVIVVVHPDDPIGRLFVPENERGRGPMAGLASGADVARSLEEANPEIAASIRAADTSRPYIVCIAYWGTTAGSLEDWGIIAPAMPTRPPAAPIGQA